MRDEAAIQNFSRRAATGLSTALAIPPFSLRSGRRLMAAFIFARLAETKLLAENGTTSMRLTPLLTASCLKMR